MCGCVGLSTPSNQQNTTPNNNQQHPNTTKKKVGRHGGGISRDVQAEMALWTAGFVVMTLVINAPLLQPLMRALKLNEASRAELQVRRSAARVILRHARDMLVGIKNSTHEFVRYLFFCGCVVLSKSCCCCLEGVFRAAHPAP